MLIDLNIIVEGLKQILGEKYSVHKDYVEKFLLVFQTEKIEEILKFIYTYKVIKLVILKI